MTLKYAVATLRTHARTLALGGLLAVFVAGVPLAPAFAMPRTGNGNTQNLCQEGDFQLFNGKIYVCHSGEWVLWSDQRI